MAAVLVTPAERARKALGLALRNLQEPGSAVAVAAAMGVSESTVSRLKNDHMESVLTLLAHLGLKVVPADFKCVDRESYEFLVRSHTRVMEKAPGLIWEQDE
jgi:transcriptional regulator with XRE-family HTH domain